MAATSTKIETSVMFVYQAGVDSKGKNIMKSQKLSNVKLDTTDQAMYDTILAIGLILAYPVDSLEKQDNYVLLNN